MPLDLSFVDSNMNYDVERIIESYKDDLEAYDLHTKRMKLVCREIKQQVECVKRELYVFTLNEKFIIVWSRNSCRNSLIKQYKHINKTRDDLYVNVKTFECDCSITYYEYCLYDFMHQEGYDINFFDNV